MQFGQVEAVPSIEAQRVEVVVRRQHPEAPRPALASEPLDPAHQRGAGAVPLLCACTVRISHEFPAIT
jgi:hypothetical protein